MRIAPEGPASLAAYTLVLGAWVAAVAPSPVRAQDDRAHPPHLHYALGEVTLESGEALGDAELLYVTHGELTAEGSNAILLPSY